MNVPFGRHNWCANFKSRKSKITGSQNSKVSKPSRKWRWYRPISIT